MPPNSRNWKIYKYPTYVLFMSVVVSCLFDLLELGFELSV